jgi:hypothetical protein
MASAKYATMRMAAHLGRVVTAHPRTEALLTYMAPVVLAAEFALEGGVR